MKNFLFLLALYANLVWANPSIKIVVPFASGSAADYTARALQETLSQELKRTFVIEYRPGAGGQVGATQVATNKSSETVLLVHSSALGVANAIGHTQYNLERDLLPVAFLGTVPLVLVTNSKLKDIPNRDVYYGSAGIGSGTHLNGDAFGKTIKKNFIHVPYKGSAALLPDLIAGRIDLSFEFWPTVIQHIESGQLNAIAVVSNKRLSQLPDIPTFTELGYKNFGFASWIVVMANSTADASDIRDVQNALNRILQDPVKSQSFRNAGIVTDLKQLLQTSTIISQEIARYQRHFREFGNLQ